MSKHVAFAIGLTGVALAAAMTGCASAPPSTGGAPAGGDSAAVSSRAPLAPVSLWGTAWRLEDLGGTAVLDHAPTLEFPEEGKAAGSGSCNQFFGGVSVAGDSIAFGAMGSTRMACDEAANVQESRYLQALADAATFAIEGDVLRIRVRGMDQPLRFVRSTP